MSHSKEKRTVTLICPYCKKSFLKSIKGAPNENRTHFTVLIKKHYDSQNCGAFLAFMDKQGLHRGSQKIDSLGDEHVINDETFEHTNEEIKELGNALRFYHLHVPRRQGGWFEHKVATVKDRAFMSSRMYSSLIAFLTDHEKEEVFGILACDADAGFEGGHLIYGKLHGMIYTLFWNDQAFFQQESLDAIQRQANRTVNKLMDVYELRDFFS